MVIYIIYILYIYYSILYYIILYYECFILHSGFLMKKKVSKSVSLGENLVISSRFRAEAKRFRSLSFKLNILFSILEAITKSFLKIFP